MSSFNKCCLQGADFKFRFNYLDSFRHKAEVFIIAREEGGRAEDPVAQTRDVWLSGLNFHLRPSKALSRRHCKRTVSPHYLLPTGWDTDSHALHSTDPKCKPQGLP